MLKMKKIISKFFVLASIVLSTWMLSGTEANAMNTSTYIDGVKYSTPYAVASYTEDNYVIIEGHLFAWSAQNYNQGAWVSGTNYHTKPSVTSNTSHMYYIKVYGVNEDGSLGKEVVGTYYAKSLNTANLFTETSSVSGSDNTPLGKTTWKANQDNTNYKCKDVGFKFYISSSELASYTTVYEYSRYKVVLYMDLYNYTADGKTKTVKTVKYENLFSTTLEDKSSSITLGYKKNNKLIGNLIIQPCISEGSSTIKLSTSILYLRQMNSSGKIITNSNYQWIKYGNKAPNGKKYSAKSSVFTQKGFIEDPNNPGKSNYYYKIEEAYTSNLYISGNGYKRIFAAEKIYYEDGTKADDAIAKLDNAYLLNDYAIFCDANGESLESEGLYITIKIQKNDAAIGSVSVNYKTKVTDALLKGKITNVMLYNTTRKEVFDEYKTASSLTAVNTLPSDTAGGTYLYQWDKMKIYKDEAHTVAVNPATGKETEAAFSSVRDKCWISGTYYVGPVYIVKNKHLSSEATYFGVYEEKYIKVNVTNAMPLIRGNKTARLSESVVLTEDVLKSAFNLSITDKENDIGSIDFLVDGKALEERTYEPKLYNVQVVVIDGNSSGKVDNKNTVTTTLTLMIGNEQPVITGKTSYTMPYGTIITLEDIIKEIGIEATDYHQYGVENENPTDKINLKIEISDAGGFKDNELNVIGIYEIIVKADDGYMTGNSTAEKMIRVFVSPDGLSAAYNPETLIIQQGETLTDDMLTALFDKFLERYKSEGVTYNVPAESMTLKSTVESLNGTAVIKENDNYIANAIGDYDIKATMIGKSGNVYHVTAKLSVQKTKIYIIGNDEVQYNINAGKIIYVNNAGTVSNTPAAGYTAYYALDKSKVLSDSEAYAYNIINGKTKTIKNVVISSLTYENAAAPNVTDYIITGIVSGSSDSFIGNNKAVIKATDKFGNTEEKELNIKLVSSNIPAVTGSDRIMAEDERLTLINITGKQDNEDFEFGTKIYVMVNGIDRIIEEDNIRIGIIKDKSGRVIYEISKSEAFNLVQLQIFDSNRSSYEWEGDSDKTFNNLNNFNITDSPGEYYITYYVSFDGGLNVGECEVLMRVVGTEKYNSKIRYNRLEYVMDIDDMIWLIKEWSGHKNDALVDEKFIEIRKKVCEAVNKKGNRYKGNFVSDFYRNDTGNYLGIRYIQKDILTADDFVFIYELIDENEIEAMKKGNFTGINEDTVYLYRLARCLEVIADDTMLNTYDKASVWRRENNPDYYEHIVRATLKAKCIEIDPSRTLYPSSESLCIYEYDAQTIKEIKAWVKTKTRNPFALTNEDLAEFRELFGDHITVNEDVMDKWVKDYMNVLKDK